MGLPGHRPPDEQGRRPVVGFAFSKQVTCVAKVDLTADRKVAYRCTLVFAHIISALANLVAIVIIADLAILTMKVIVLSRVDVHSFIFGIPSGMTIAVTVC